MVAIGAGGLPLLPSPMHAYFSKITVRIYPGHC